LNQDLINKLINDDCFNVFPLIEDKSIDLILCDLPYGTTACKWDTILPFDKLWIEYNRIIKDNGVIVLTASQPFTSALVMSNPKMFRYEWIWVKNKASNFQLSKKQPLKNHESILVFSKGKVNYNPQGLKDVSVKQSNSTKRNLIRIAKTQNECKPYIQTIGNYPKSVFEFNCEQGLHPTQKPVALFEYLIKTYTNEEAIILDNCCGVATTAIAAINTNRNYICIEKDVNYYNIGLNRIQEKK
jgi:site-specific DNA-methyltransferase (adenine-specific)